MDPKSEKYQVFNYADIFFSYYANDERRCTKMVRNLTLVYVYGGKFILEENGHETVIGPEECVFLKRDTRVNMVKQASEENPFQGIFMNFNRKTMREIFQKIGKQNIPQTTENSLNSVVKLPYNAAIQSLFLSLEPYFDSSIKPAEEIMNLKVIEGVYALLSIDKRFYPVLFDFNEPWKIDILDFLNENYMFDLSLEDIASFTGRSLSTFKRDFQKISPLSPQKWIIHKRLEAAHDMLLDKKKHITDIYMEVGFKNLSHFSSAFKKQYGVSPSSFN